jgi:hypothetical protein
LTYHSSLMLHAVDDHGVLLVPLPEIASSKTLKNVIDQNETTATKWRVFWKAEKSRSKSKTHRVGALVKMSSLVFPRRMLEIYVG